MIAVAQACNEDNAAKGQQEEQAQELLNRYKCPRHFSFELSVSAICSRVTAERVTWYVGLYREANDLEKVEKKLESHSTETVKVKNQLSSIAADREKCQKDKEAAERQLMELGSLPEAFDK